MRQKELKDYVELDYDMYCFTICANMSPELFNPLHIEDLIGKCFLVFFLQIGVSSFFYWQMNVKENIQNPEFAPQCVRLMCSLLMHLFIHPELRQALSIIHFLKVTRDEKYLKGRGMNFIIAMMKMVSAIYCEIILIIMISHVDDISDIIKDFVALGFIVEIDDMFAKNMKYYNVETVIDKFKQELEIENYDEYREEMKDLVTSWLCCCFKQRSKQRMHNSTFTDFVILVVHFICRELYVIVYYYCFFYLVVIINTFFSDV